MVKKYVKIVLVCLMIIAVVLPTSSIIAAENSTIEVSEVRSLGEKAIVPVILRNTTYLTSGQLTISLSDTTNKGVSLASFKPAGLFDGEAFRTVHHLNGNTITVDFISQTGEEQKLTDKAMVIGYITYNLSDEFVPGQSVSLDVSNVVAKGKKNADIAMTTLGGSITHRMLVGDVIGNNKVTATGAMRVLQHIKGDYITDREQFLSADVDADGVLTQNDATQILDYATGKRTTFLAVAAKEMNTAVLKSEYREVIEARHGRAPYEFKRKSGSLPAGVTLNVETGELTGTPTRASDYTFVVQVTDAVGDTADRTFNVAVIDSNITAVDKLNTVNVKRGETPVLPSQVTVTYKNKTKGKENVTWGPVDTSALGEVTVKGTIGDTGFIVQMIVNVVNENYIKNIAVGFFEMLNVYTVVVDTTADVYAMTVNNIPAHYEGNNQFSLASASFTAGSSVTIRLYDKYGNLLETKAQQLVIN